MGVGELIIFVCGSVKAFNKLKPLFQKLLACTHKPIQSGGL
jgi:hypothetical protein